jgi:hypothetical protein
MTDHQYAIGLCAFYATYIARYALCHQTVVLCVTDVIQ